MRQTYMYIHVFRNVLKKSVYIVLYAKSAYNEKIDDVYMYVTQC